MNKIWQAVKSDDLLSQTFSRELGLSLPTARVLVNRGVGSLEAARVFLNPRLAHLSDPLEIPNIRRAAERVLAAVERREKVLIFGDYDVDGVTGTAILLKVLRRLGLEAAYYIPHRYDEGYSLSQAAVREAAESGVRLIVTVDCGVSNVLEVKTASELGIDVVVTDHHNLPDRLPEAYSVVNPKMISGRHPCRDLSGAGVAFKFAWALLKTAGVKDNVFLTSLLDLAALGTVSDVVPLLMENRILAVTGLRLLNERRRLGLKCLAEAASLSGRITVNSIYYALAPRINAAGRLEHASRSLELLLTEDESAAENLAGELDRINLERRGIGSKIREDVFALLNEAYIAENKLVVLSGENWHPGVIGIVASQAAETFIRPVVLIGINEGVGRGSARSIAGVNVFKLLDACRDLFHDFGGHAGAAGFEIDPAKIPQLSERLSQAADEQLKPEDLKPRIEIDAELDIGAIDLNLARELEVLGPHGEANPAPVFVSRGLALADIRRVGSNGRHLKLKLKRGGLVLDAIGFSLGDLADKLDYNSMYDAVYNLECNEWNGFETAQLSLIDIRRTQ